MGQAQQRGFGLEGANSDLSVATHSSGASGALAIARSRRMNPAAHHRNRLAA